MIHLRVPPEDPYVRFRALIGGEPQVLLHGDDLGAGGSTIVSWSGRRSSLAGSGVGSPTVNASGWAGGGSLTLKTCSLNGSSQGVGLDAAGAAYAAGTPFTWIVAAKLTASAAVRSVLALGNTGTTNHARLLGLTVTTDTARFRSVVNGTAETDTGTAITEGAQIILGCTFTGSAVRVVRLATGGVETVLLNNAAHSGAGTLTINSFNLGFLKGPTNIEWCAGEFRFAAALSGVAASDANLSKLLVHTRDSLRCPL